MPPETPGGSYFAVKVSPGDFTPRHDASGAATVALMKSTEGHDGSAGGASRIDADKFGCTQTRGEYAYRISGDASDLPADPAARLTCARDPLDSFEVAR